MKYKLITLQAGKLLCLSFVICLLSFCIGACSSIECPVQNTVSTQYAIVGADGASMKLTDTLWVWTCRSDDTDTLLLNRGVGLSSFSLPVSYAHPEDTLVFCLGDTLGNLTLDTVWVKKEDIPHFESVDCSAHFFHRLTGVRSTHRFIDSIAISNASVTYDQSTTHFTLRFKTQQ